MSQPVANAVANLLGKVARYSVLLGVGGSALQASLYTGQADVLCVNILAVVFPMREIVSDGRLT